MAGKEAAILCLLVIFVSFLPGGRFMVVPDGVRQNGQGDLREQAQLVVMLPQLWLLRTACRCLI